MEGRRNAKFYSQHVDTEEICKLENVQMKWGY
jgi:hypothetical protein